MVTCLYFLSLVFQAVLLELWESLEDVMQVFLCNVHCLDLLQSWECEEKLLCGEDLLCGISCQWQYVFKCLWHDVLWCGCLWYDLE